MSRGARESVMTRWAQACVERLLVQILVVVATIQMRTLKTDVEKGSAWTAIGRGWVGPERKGNSVSCRLALRSAKGNRVNIPEPGLGYDVATQRNPLTQEWAPGSVVFSSWQASTLESDYLEKGFIAWHSTSTSGVSGTLSTALEKAGSTSYSPSWPYPLPHQVSKVSSLWSSRLKLVREVGKIDP